MNELLDLALKAHGGLERWREVKSLDVRISLTGALYKLKSVCGSILIPLCAAEWRLRDPKEG
jgi:hypothetical protein